MNPGSTFKRCGCRDADGKLVGRCGRLRSSKHGSWYYAVDLPVGADGKRRLRRRGGFSTQAAAQAALDELRGRHGAGLDIARPVTIGEYLDEWIASKRRIRANTLRSYRGHIESYLKPHLGHLRVDRLRVADVATMFDAVEAGNAGRERPVGPATMGRIRATLRAALTDAVRRRLTNVNIASLVELAEVTRPPVTVWSAEQAGQFLAAIAKGRLYPLFHLIVAVGLRRGEACGLPWTDVDLDTGTLRVSQQLVEVAGHASVGRPKTARGARVIALDETTVGVLREHRRRQLGERLRLGEAWQDCGLVFVREDGRPLNPATVTRTFKRLAAAARLPMIHLHDLRHTSASVGLATGESMKEISDRLGHSSITITADTYTHVAPALARESAQRRAAAIGAVVGLPDGPPVPTANPQNSSAADSDGAG